MSDPDSLQNPPRHTFAFDADVGLGLLGFTYDVGVSYHVDNIFFGVRGLRSHQIVFGEFSSVGGSSPHFKRPVESIWEVDGYVGAQMYDQGLRAAALIGLSVGGGILRGDYVSTDYTYDQYERLESTVVGVPIQARLTFIPFGGFGVSVRYLMNLNSKKTYKGFTFGVQALLY